MVLCGLLETVCVAVLVAIVYVVVDKLRRKPRVDRIQDKHVFITGCDTGFGRALAVKLDGMGVPVFAGCLTEEGVEGLRNEASTRLKPLLMDVTDSESVLKATQTVQLALPSDDGLWGLVNNAGVLDTFSGWDFLLKKDWDRVFGINVFGLADSTYQFLPLIKKSRGRIVNMASLAGRVSFPNFPVYCASKHAVESISDSLRRDMAPWGVKVSVIEPTYHATPIVDPAIVLDTVERRWREMPRERRDEYGNEWHQANLKNVKAALAAVTQPNIYDVVDTYIEALFALNPKSRYIVGNLTTRKQISLAMLPDFVSDMFYNTVYNVVPQALRGAK